MDVVLGAQVKNAAPGEDGREPAETVRSSGQGGAAVAGLQVREVEVSFRAVESSGGVVVGHGGFLRGGKRAEPEARSLLGLSDLGHPLSPCPLADAPVLAGGV